MFHDIRDVIPGAPNPSSVCITDQIIARDLGTLNAMQDLGKWPHPPSARPDRARLAVLMLEAASWRARTVFNHLDSPYL